MSDTRTLILLFAEGDFSHVTQMNSRDRAQCFVYGVSEGANLYGAGSCGAYVWPDHEKQMREDESAAEVERALKAMREYAARQKPPMEVP